MPFHPTHINPQNQRDRRHGYADLLRHPKRYDVHWRVWSGGTARFLLWGDPEYVRRFVESAQIYGGNSFEVNEMLATKMLGEPHDAEPFQLHTPAYRHYDYEFQRYWHYYQVWGRVSYNPQADPEIWQREFVRRFGESGWAAGDAGVAPRQSHPAADRRGQLQLSLLSHHARLGRNDAARRSSAIRQGDWH